MSSLHVGVHLSAGRSGRLAGGKEESEAAVFPEEVWKHLLALFKVQLIILLQGQLGLILLLFGFDGVIII